MSTYGTSQLFGLFGLFKSSEFFSKHLYFFCFEKALTDTSNFSISFVPIEFMIFFVKVRFLNFTMLFGKFKYLNLFKSYELFSKYLHFREAGVCLSLKTIYSFKFFCNLYEVLLKENCSKVYKNLPDILNDNWVFLHALGSKRPAITLKRAKKSDNLIGLNIRVPRQFISTCFFVISVWGITMNSITNLNSAIKNPILQSHIFLNCNIFFSFNF